MHRAATYLTSKGQTMEAMLQDIYGPPDVLHLGDAEKPDPAPNEVLVQVRAAGVDRGTAHLMRGEPYLLRILGFGFRGPKQPVPGKDVAGTVVQVGSDVTEFEVGDEVFGIANGSFAELAVARADKLVHKPAHLTFEQAAVVPISATTAMQALRDVGHLSAGQRVLIIGASGGVGTYAVQIAKALGATVTGVASTAKVDLVRSLGADEVIDYTHEDFADGATHFDLILDIGGNSRIARLRHALAPKGTLVIVGGESGKWTGVGRQLRAVALSPIVPQRLAMFVNKERHEDLDAVRGLIEAGQVTPMVDRTFSLAEVPEALRHLEAGLARGKIAISI
jgi:2-desacetyl-2-hydroxyethyl bacteriochlorophyllide A dehydrogenase